MSSLVITKQTGNFFSLVLDSGDAIISEQNRLTTIGNFCNFKTANGANLILKQNILYSEITIIDGGSHVPTSVNDLWISLLDAGFFDGLATKQDFFISDDSLYFYEDGDNTFLASNISQIITSFVWNIGDSTTFTLPFVPTNLIAIFINGLKLYKSEQYNIVLPDKIEILQTLYDEDVIEFTYEHYNQIP